MSSPHSSPLSNHTLGSSTVPADHGANDGPSRRDLLSKLRHSRIGKNSELGRLWSARWVHPQRKAYIHAFIDTTACWFFALTLLYINNIYWVAETLLYTNDRAGAFLTLQTYWQTIIATAVGAAFGGFFKSIGDSKEQKIESRLGKVKSHIVLARLRLPLWLYLCITFVTTFILSFMASGGIKNMVSFPTAPGYEDYVNYQFHDNWYGVVTSICAVSIVAVTAGAIMRHRLLVHKAEADDVVDEQVRIVKVERMPDVMA